MAIPDTAVLSLKTARKAELSPCTVFIAPADLSPVAAAEGVRGQVQPVCSQLNPSPSIMILIKPL